MERFTRSRKEKGRKGGEGKAWGGGAPVPQCLPYRNGPRRTFAFLRRCPRKRRLKLPQTRYARYVSALGKGGPWVLPRPQWCPGKPLSPLPRRQDSAVQSSSTPKFEKVPTVSSFQISNHFLSSSQDLSGGNAPHQSEQGRPSWDPFAALSRTPRALTGFHPGHLSRSGSARRPRGSGTPAVAAAEPGPPPGPPSGALEATATSQRGPENQCAPVEKQLEQEVTRHRPSPFTPLPLRAHSRRRAPTCPDVPRRVHVSDVGRRAPTWAAVGGAARDRELIGRTGCGRGSCACAESHRQAGPLFSTRHWSC